MNTAHYKIKFGVLNYIYTNFEETSKKTLDEIIINNNNILQVKHSAVMYKGVPYQSTYAGAGMQILSKVLIPQMDAYLLKRKTVYENKQAISSYLNRVLINFPLDQIHKILPKCVHAALPLDLENDGKSLLLSQETIDNFNHNNEKEITMIKIQLMSNLIQS